MDGKGLLGGLTKIGRARTLRASSWNTSGGNRDFWTIGPGETRVLAELEGPGSITHIWMTQRGRGTYRDVVLKMYWDGERDPSVNSPLGDFFCLGHGIINSFQSLPFSASTTAEWACRRGGGCALNSYLQMPFAEGARIEVTNEGRESYNQYFYVDYELHDEPLAADTARFHAQFRRDNPAGGWGHDVRVNAPEVDIPNTGREAWENNYLILEAEGEGHYIGCNMSVANFQGTWWGEGDDMIWVDGDKWPPDLHGTGSEDYFNQAWGMQPNAYLMNGSSIHEKATGGYQSSYVFHLTNPVRFTKSIRATIEHGHANHLANDVSSVAYWYQREPHRPFRIPPVSKRRPVDRIVDGEWVHKKSAQCPGRVPELTPAMKKAKRDYAARIKREGR
jgi:hypothetical protein